MFKKTLIFLFYIFSINHLTYFPLCVTIKYKIKQRIEYQGGKEDEKYYRKRTEKHPEQT